MDASSIATGVALGVIGSIFEDACWLRPINDPRHINLAELDAVIKGVNLALQWQARVLHIVTDSACVHWWVSDTLTGKARVNTKAADEMLARRRLGTLRALVEEHALTMNITLVKSCQNRTDSLTRVSQRWLDLHKKEGEPIPESCAVVTCQLSKSQVTDIHQKSGHPGVKRTLYFARIIDPTVSKEVVRDCEACQSIDPGDLSVKKNWSSLAMDVTHYDGGHFLTMIDCGPSRFSVWRPLRQQDSISVIPQLGAIFYERGQPAEILTDNDNAFTCRQFKEFTSSRGVHLRFRRAHVPAGNGIVEGSHRSIKTIAARKNCPVLEAVY